MGRAVTASNPSSRAPGGLPSSGLLRDCQIPVTLGKAGIQVSVSMRFFSDMDRCRFVRRAKADTTPSRRYLQGEKCSEASLHS